MLEAYLSHGNRNTDHFRRFVEKLMHKCSAIISVSSKNQYKQNYVFHVHFYFGVQAIETLIGSVTL